MKTVCKRLLTLMLVAVMLVSAVPMAFAATGTVTLYYQFGEDSSTQVEIGASAEITDSAVAQNLFEAWEGKGEYVLQSVNIWGDAQEGVDENRGDWLPATSVVYPGQHLKFILKPVEEDPTDPTETQPTETQPTETQPTETQPTDPSETQPTDNSKTITLYYYDGNDARQSMEVTTNADNELDEVPVPPVVRTNYDFIGWYSKDGTQGGDKLSANTEVEHDVYYARYQANYNNPKYTVEVYGRVYVGGVYKATTGVLVSVKAFEGSKTLDELKAQTEAIKTALNKTNYSTYNGYEWEANEIFYDDSSLTDPVKQTDKIKSNDTYYIRINYTNNNDREHLEKVQIYVHTKKNSTINRTITLTTYAPGETITKSIVTNAVKKYYSVANKNVKMYDIESWEQILDGNANTDETAEFEVVRGDDTHIHVLLSGATSKGDTTSSSNPKTGDAIFMTITALGLSGTALVALYFINKKKTIV